MKLDQLVFHPWVAQTPRDIPAFVGGEGSFLIDHAGRRYLDFSSQLVFTNVGHQHPRVVSVIKEQADRLCTLAPLWASDVRGEAAKMLSRVDGAREVYTESSAGRAGSCRTAEQAVGRARRHLEVLTAGLTSRR